MRFVLGALFLLSVSGCRHVHPWERGTLAHPSMTTAGAPAPAAEHVYGIQEGAAGGSGVAESGCGCN
jgi:hypothetical protein